MLSTISWEELSPLIEKRLQNLSQPSQPVPFNFINLNPFDSPCFTLENPNSELEAKHFSSPIRPIPNALNVVKETGQNLERNKEKDEVLELLGILNRKIKAKFTEAVDQACESLFKRLVSRLLPGQSALSFFESFSDGLLNEDTKFLEEFEKMIRTMEFSRPGQIWTKRQLLTGIEILLEEAERIAEAVKSQVLGLFETLRQPSNDGKPFGMVREIVKAGEMLNNLNKDPITNGFGLDVNSESGEYLSLSAAGDLVSFDSSNGKKLFQTKVLEGTSNSYDCCKWSPSGRIIGVTLNISKKIKFFSQNGGEKLTQITHCPWTNPISCTWQSDSVFCVGHSDGFVRCFNPFDPSNWSQISVSSFWISGLEQFNDQCILAMDQANSVHCINTQEKRVIWAVPSVHKQCTCSCKFGIKRSFDGLKVATGGHCDGLIKTMRLSDQRSIWERNIERRTWGFTWVPGDTYLIVLGNNPSLMVILSGRDGQNLMTSKLLADCVVKSLSLDADRNLVLIGDQNGLIQKLKLVD